MKKAIKSMICAVVCGAIAFSSAACGKSTGSASVDASRTQETEVKNTSTGSDAEADGFARPDSPVVTDEIHHLLEKAVSGMTGAEYLPVAYLGSQAADGTNYRILCRVAPVVPDPVENYGIVELHENTDGNVEITNVLDSKRSTDISDSEGGWFQPESPVVPDDVKEALKKATKEKSCTEYDPAALLSEQVVAGMNYCILCERTSEASDTGSIYSLVYLYEDLDGNSEITETVDFS
jgi:hypothetical protein